MNIPMDNIPVDINFFTRDEAEGNMDLELIKEEWFQVNLFELLKYQILMFKHVLEHMFLELEILVTIKINKTERVQDGVERIDFTGCSCIFYSK